MLRDNKIYVAGHTGLVGSAILNKLNGMGCNNVIVCNHDDLDLTNQSDVQNFFKIEKPDYVILAAAKVGGINANIKYPAEFIYENTIIQTNVIHSAYTYCVKKLLFFCSACSYPSECAQPMQEDSLLTGPLEKTNEPYAMAKLNGMKMCEAYNRQYGCNFISAVLTNAYGPNDNFNTENSHVIPSLIKRFHNAKFNNKPSVDIWGTGNVKREFIYVHDVSEAVIFLLENYNESYPINVGVEGEVSIKELVFLIKDVVQFKGDISFDTSKPDGVLRKTLDISKIRELGWKPSVSLKDGLQQTYKWFLGNIDKVNN